ncbi:MAG TPA: hypothetical protein ENJ53_09290, partial [Phaeodactylibacter sp.]|nr:hypothetical protein [Phaeodactylibacter sp.]
MKQILPFIFFFIFFQSLTGQLSDDFSDGNFTTNPVWSGDIDNFIVNSDGMLQLNTSGSDTSILYTTVEIPDSTVWEMQFRLDFAPSGNNRLRIFLQADANNFSNVNGYYLEIGESGADDALRLFRTDAGNNTEIATATIGALGNAPARAKIKITRSKLGNWSVFANYDGGNILNLETTAFDNTYLGGNLFFGFWCKNTSSNAQNFFFDNITITSLLPDLTAPSVTQITPLSLTEIEVSFDEALDSLTAVTLSNYLVNNSIGNPQMATWSSANQSTIRLTFNNAFTNQTSYNLTIQNIQDQAENTIISTTIPFDINFEAPELIEVVATSPTELELVFNQSINNITASLSTNYTINNNIGNPINAELDPIEPQRVYLELATELVNGTPYLLQVQNIKNELGIELVSQNFPFDFLIAESIEPNDLIINEILFNPKTGGSDFVEIYNHSTKFLDISDLLISNTQRTTGRDKEVEITHILRPKEYAVLTPHLDHILENYTVNNPDVLFENSLPSFNDASGNVSLFTTYGMDTVMIDSFDYAEDFHYPLLDDKEGISLERISFDAPTQSRSTWHSASTLIGGATPTFKNSQLRPTTTYG